MKYVLLAIFVLFAAQPLQAVSCDMHDAQGTSHGQHDDMQGNDGMDMDCCDQEPSVPADNCESMFHCGTCTAVAVAISPSAINVNFHPGSHPLLLGNGEPVNRFNTPPFRPPIA